MGYTAVGIIQGDIRTKNINLVTAEMEKIFDKVIVSTWQGEESKLPKGNFEVILNKPPVNKGITHRNFQRLSTAAGLKLARELKAEFVMKWRTDCLPTSIDLRKLIDLSTNTVPEKFTSRIVMPAFRNLSVAPDWFSSFPDHFAFGRLNEMELLWSDKDFDYTREFNCPPRMFDNTGISLVDGKIFHNDKDFTFAYDAHNELYALYRGRLEESAAQKLDHPSIALNYLNLIDHEKLKICWFNPQGGFRSITQSLEFPWWTERGYRQGSYKTAPVGFNATGVSGVVGKIRSRLVVKRNQLRQKVWLNTYVKSISSTSN